MMRVGANLPTQSNPRMQLRVFALRSIAIVFLLGVIDQICRLTILSDNLFLGRPVAPFDPPLFSPSQRAKYTRIANGDYSGTNKFDPDLGWCNKPNSGFGEYSYDWAGSRIGGRPLDQVKPKGVRRVVAIGCSMTHGEEVAAEETWCAQVDKNLAALEIANLGVAAYGIDQALMRLVRDGPTLNADEVWLGLLPSAALRITTLYRPVLDHWSLDVAFKPRFVIQNDSRLHLLSCPIKKIEDIALLLSDQQAFLKALNGGDTWVERTPEAYAPRGSHWSHYSFGARIILTCIEARGRAPLESFADSSDENYKLLARIVLECAEEARRQGCTFRLIILPGKADLDAWQERGVAPWQAWMDQIKGHGIEVIDVSEALILAEDQPVFALQGHYSPAGNRIVAGAIVDQLGFENSGQ